MGKKLLFSAIVATLLLETTQAMQIGTFGAKSHRDLKQEANYALNDVIVTFKDGSSMSRMYKIVNSIFSGAKVTKYNLINAMHIKVPSMGYKTIKKILLKTPILKDSIESVEKNYKVKANTNDSYYSKLWAIENTGQSVNNKSGTNDADMDVKEAWSLTKGSSDVVVAVLDTGVDYTHSDLSDNMWSGNSNHGYDFAGDNDGNNDDNPMPDKPYDDNGHYHGTHVAGTIGAVGDNSNGVTGVAQNVKIMAVKIFRPNGYGYSSDILEGLDYVSQQIDNGVNVVAINASYGGGGGSQGDSMDKAIQKLGDKGVVFCAAAGNDGKNIDNNPVYPASYDATNIITVAASDQDDKLASFSNYGKKTVEVAAPGTNILSTYPDDQYAYLQGTSMATPNVVGTVALLASLDPSSSVKERIEAIENGVDKKADLTNKLSTDGRVNAFNALKVLDNGDENSNPVANSDSANTSYETKVTIDVLKNDTDADGDSLKIKSVTNPSHGTAVVKNGKVEYTPDSGFSGDDSFNYTISDGNGGEDSAKVAIHVDSKANSAPVAKDDSASLNEDSKKVIDVLANDSDADGDTLEIKSVTNPSHGRVVIKNGKVEYTPDSNYNGNDSFKYTIDDGHGAQDSAEVKVTINAVNDAPSAQDDSAKTDYETKVTIDVLANDSDVDGDSLSIKSVSSPSNGTAVIKNGKVEYTPNDGFSGDDNFSYQVTDGNAVVTANVTVEVKEKKSNGGFFGGLFGGGDSSDDNDNNSGGWFW